MFAEITLEGPNGLEETIVLTGPTWVDVWFENKEGDAKDDDGDGRDEVVFTHQNVVYALAEQNGEAVLRWRGEVGGSIWEHELGPPVIADVRGQGEPQILLNTAGGFLISLGSPATPAARFMSGPRKMPSSET